MAANTFRGDMTVEPSTQLTLSYRDLSGQARTFTQVVPDARAKSIRAAGHVEIDYRPMLQDAVIVLNSSSEGLLAAFAFLGFAGLLVVLLPNFIRWRQAKFGPTSYAPPSKAAPLKWKPLALVIALASAGAFVSVTFPIMAGGLNITPLIGKLVVVALVFLLLRKRRSGRD